MKKNKRIAMKADPLEKAKIRLIAESKAPEARYDKYDAMGYVQIARQALAKAESK